MEHYGVPLPPPEYGPAFTAGERVLITHECNFNALSSIHTTYEPY